MKLLVKVLGVFISMFIVFNVTVHAGFLSDLLDSGRPSIGYCEGDNDCSLEGGLEVVGENYNAGVVDRTASQYIQDIVIYLISFLSIVAVIYVIYAGFNILTGAGDEEKMKKSKSIIVYVIVGLLIIYLAYAIVTFVFRVFDAPAENPPVTFITTVKNI